MEWYTGIQLVVIAFGSAVATFAFDIAFRRKSRSAFWFAMFAAGATLNHIASMISWMHEKLNGHPIQEAPAQIRVSAWIFTATGLVLLIMSPPRFSHSVAGIPQSLFFKVLEGLELSIAAAGGVLLLLFPSQTTAIELALLALLLEVLFRSSLYLFVRGTPGMEKVSRRLSFATIAVSAVFPAVYGLASAASKNLTGETTSYIFSLFFIAGMSLMSVAVRRSFDHPPFFRDGALSDYFILKFSLSRREAEIVGHILLDADNKTIASSLGVSVRTVENHLHTVYGKTRVGSRVELARLVRSSA